MSELKQLNSISLDDLLKSIPESDRPARYTEVQIGGSTIRVLKYLGVQAKLDIANAIIQRCLNINTVDPIIFYTELALSATLLGTNIIIPDEKKANRIELFEELNHSGVISAVMEAIEPSEIADIVASVNEAVRANGERYTSITGAVESILNLLQDRMEGLSSVLENLDEDKFTQLLEKAKGAV